MPTLADLDELRQGIVVLAHLARAEPLNMTEFTEASGLFPVYAKRLRERLAALGLIEVTVVRRQGPAEILEIRLTPIGREVAERAAAIDDLMAGAGG